MGRASLILAATIALLAVADGVIPIPDATNITAGVLGPDPDSGFGTRSTSSVPPSTDRNVYNVTVASEPGRYKGWPANYGMWAWGDEMVVMYLDARFDRTKANREAVDLSGDVHVEQARSHDGGLTWAIEEDPIKLPRPAAQPLKERLDFQAPGFALYVGFSGDDNASTLYYSYDKAKTWNGPFTLPQFGMAAVRGRTAYVVNGRRDAQLFLVASPQGEDWTEHHPVVVRTTDGGLNWRFVANVGRVPPVDPAKADVVTEPAAVRLADGSLLAVGRAQTYGTGNDATKGTFTFEASRSTDGGRTWQPVSTVGNFNNGQNSDGATPPSLTRLPNNWVVLTYGYRLPLFGVRARMSKDGGATWSDEVTLRQDGGSYDLGYTRSVVRPDGRLVTAYYYNTNVQRERSIEATVWNPLTAFEGF